MTLPFDPAEYDDRLATLVDLLELHGLDGVVLTAPEHLAYFAGYLPRWQVVQAGLVVTKTDAVLLHPTGGVVAACPVQVVDALWPAVARHLGTGRELGLEAGHLSMTEADVLNGHLRLKRGMDISPALRQIRLTRAPAEVDLLATISRVLAQAVAAGQARAAARQAQDGLEAAFAHLPVQVQADLTDGVLRIWATVAGYGAEIARPLADLAASSEGGDLVATGWPLAHLSQPSPDLAPEEGTVCARHAMGGAVTDMVLIAADGPSLLTQV